MKSLRLTLSIFIGSVLYCLPASHSLASDASSQPIILDPVIVIATPENNPLEFSRDPKQAQLPVPASDATDYLKTTPGFAATRSGGANGDPVFRGMFGSRLNILANGANIFGGCGSRMDAPSSYISPESYDRVTITKGPQTVLWGGGAYGATIRFDRLPPRYTEPTANFRAGLLAGSYDRFDEYLEAAGGTDAFYARFNGNYARSSDYKDGNGKTVPSKWMKWNADAALGWTPDEDTVFELSAGTGDGYARYAGRAMDGSEFIRDSLNLKFEKKDLGPVLEKLEFQVFYNHIDHTMDNYSLRPTPGMKKKSNPTRTLYGGRTAATFNTGETGALIAGLDFLFDEHDTWSTANPDRQTDMRTFKTGLFGEFSVWPDDNDEMIIGLRGDYIRAKDYRDQTTADQYDGTRDKLLPSAFIRHEHSFNDVPLMSYIGIGYTERFPDYWEIRQNIDASRKAFSSLEPEKTLQLDAGFQYKAENLELWTSAYAGLIFDYILFDYGASTTVKNIDARIAGAELGAACTIFEHLRLSSSLAYAWGENTSDNAPLPQMPPLEVRLGAECTTERWQAGFLWRLVAEQNRVAENQGNVVGKDFGSSPGFGVLSIYGGVRVFDNFDIKLGIDNVFDAAYYEHLNMAGNAGWGFDATDKVYEPGRVVWSRFTVTF